MIYVSWNLVPQTFVLDVYRDCLMDFSLRSWGDVPAGLLKEFITWGVMLHIRIELTNNHVKLCTDFLCNDCFIVPHQNRALKYRICICAAFHYFLLWVVILRCCFSLKVCRGVPTQPGCERGWRGWCSAAEIRSHVCKYWEEISCSQEGNSFVSSQWAYSHGTW